MLNLAMAKFKKKTYVGCCLAVHLLDDVEMWKRTVETFLGMTEGKESAEASLTATETHTSLFLPVSSISQP